MKLHCLRSVLCVLLLCAALAVSASASVLRVKWDSPNDGSGNDWDHAFHTVTAALATAAAGDEIWVAGNRDHPYYERITLKNGVGLYGGFAGGETARDQRDWNTNRTILHGSGSSYPVVQSPSSATAATVLDGFTMRNGSDGIRCKASSPTIANNAISGNNGSGVYCDAASSPLIVNNTISANGTGIYLYGSPLTSVTNNTITSNGTVGVYCWYSSPALTNNIIAFNRYGVFNCYSSGNPALRRNCVHNPSGHDYTGLPAGDDDIQDNPRFVAAAYGNLHIQPDSPCVDVGLDSAVEPAWKDMDGQSRIQGGRVDIGADESCGHTWPDHIAAIVRVSPKGIDDELHDGSSWPLAKRTIQAGLDAASASGGEVWVAAGTYAEKVVLFPYVYMYGGFAGHESARELRNWATNESTIDIYTTGAVVTAMCGSVGRIDGFIVRRGSTGIDCGAGSPVVANNTVTDNRFLGIACGGGEASVVQNTIRNNGQSGIGLGSGSAGVITGNRISDNAYDGVLCFECSPVISNNTITGGRYGVNCESSQATVINNTIAGCAYGGVYCVNGAAPRVTNNVIAFNESGFSSYYGGTPQLRTNCLYNPEGTDYGSLPTGESDIQSDPLFVDRAAGNYHILASSPCIDAGSTDAADVPLLDYDGEGRIYGRGVDIGADESWPSMMKVGDTKTAPDGAIARTNWALVTAVFGDAAYIEELNRSSGIRVEKSANGLSLGRKVAVTGKMTTTSQGERAIQADAVALSGSGNLAALCIPNRFLGGGPLRCSWSDVPGQAGVIGSAGLNNIGLLVRLAGRVESFDAGGAYFVLSDGSGVHDPDGRPGVRVVSAAMMPPGLAAGDFVAVTGISSCYKAGEDLYPQLLTRSAEDIQVVSP